MAQIVWTEPALQDLEEIAEYIELENPAAAQRLVRRVFGTIERLVDFPESGRRPPEIPKTGYREKISGPCRIFYRVEESKVLILYIMRGERALRRWVLDERKRRR